MKKVLRPIILFFIMAFSLVTIKVQAQVKVVKGVYYVRVADSSVLSFPICDASNASSVLSGTSAIKRMCRNVSTYSITRPFTGFGLTGLGDTIGLYFRIDYTDTAQHDEFADSLKSLSYIEVVEELPEFAPSGNVGVPNDKYVSKQWYLDKIKTFEAHEHSK